MMTAAVYGTSALNGRRYRRTKAELAEIDAAIYEIAEAEEPVTVRGLFYRVMSLRPGPQDRARLQRRTASGPQDAPGRRTPLRLDHRRQPPTAQASNVFQRPSGA